MDWLDLLAEYLFFIPVQLLHDVELVPHVLIYSLENKYIFHLRRIA